MPYSKIKRIMISIKTILNKNRSLVSIYVLISLIISQIALPYLNNGKDYFIFSTWNLFSFRKNTKVFDLYCRDSSNSFYFFRDKTFQTYQNQLNYKAILKIVKQNKNISIQQRQNAMELCPGRLELHWIKMSYFEHFALKKDANNYNEIKY